MVALLVALPLLVLISLSVFGGGQVFIPVFKWLWQLLASAFGADISEDVINHVLTVSNATPGVVSTKFAFFTGYIVANGEWWGYLAMFLTYLVFTIPALAVIVIAMKYVNKFENTQVIQKILLYMKPVIAGIIISIAVQLIISLMFPFLSFNDSGGTYAAVDETKDQAKFFSGWRRIVLLIYFPINVLVSYYLHRKKVSLFLIIASSTILSLIVFMPWL